MVKRIAHLNAYQEASGRDREASSRPSAAATLAGPLTGLRYVVPFTTARDVHVRLGLGSVHLCQGFRHSCVVEINEARWQATRTHEVARSDKPPRVALG